jgi:hypothetical protein
MTDERNLNLNWRLYCVKEPPPGSKGRLFPRQAPLCLPQSVSGSIKELEDHIGIIFADSESAVSNALIWPFPQPCQARRLTGVRPPGERIVNRLGDADRAGVGRARSLIEGGGADGSESLWG